MTTGWIIGKGPSLLNLRDYMIGAGPVVTLNEAILPVRKLHLPNMIYVFQKDGCEPHGPDGYLPPGPGHGCRNWIQRPEPPEVALFSLQESPHCQDDYQPRILIDVEALGIPWYTPSSPTATKWLATRGVDEIVYVAHDARFGELRAVEHGIHVTDRIDGGYVESWRTAERLATEAGLRFRYLTP